MLLGLLAGLTVVGGVTLGATPVSANSTGQAADVRTAGQSEIVRKFPTFELCLAAGTDGVRRGEWQAFICHGSGSEYALYIIR